MHCNVIVTNYNCRRLDISQCNMKYSEVNQSMSLDNTTAYPISNEHVEPSVPVYEEIISTRRNFTNVTLGNTNVTVNPVFDNDDKMEANPAYGGVFKMQPNPAYQDPTSL